MTGEVTVRIEWHQAREAGALDGWDIECSRCGNAGGSSLEVLARQWAAEHAAWHAKAGR
jgi:hypothetical protein